MGDTVSPKKRSKVVAKVLSKSTKLELPVIKALYAAELRFHLHYSSVLAPQTIVPATHGWQYLYTDASGIFVVTAGFRRFL